MSSNKRRPERKYVPLRRKKIDKPIDEDSNTKYSKDDVFQGQNIQNENVSQNINSSNSEDKYDGIFKEVNKSDILENDGRQKDFNQKKDNKSNSEEESEPILSSKDSNSGTAKAHDLVIDPKMPYFFVFGIPSSGKTAMLAGLIYYLKTLANGQLKTLNSQDKINHKKGQYLMAHMQQSVRSGQFVTGTKAIDKTEFIFPSEINLEFIPDDNSKPVMPFCLLDMAGEDQKSVMFLDEGLSGGELDERISAYLEHPKCPLVFIFAIDLDFPAESEDLIDRFLDYIESLGHTENPILFTVNKWDTQRAKYESVEEYFEENLHILNRRRMDPNRFSAILDFSVGEVYFDSSKNIETYKYDPKDSERLMKWMYEISTGYKIDEKMQESNLKKLFNSIKRRFKNG